MTIKLTPTPHNCLDFVEAALLVESAFMVYRSDNRLPDQNVHPKVGIGKVIRAREHRGEEDEQYLRAPTLDLILCAGVQSAR